MTNYINKKENVLVNREKKLAYLLIFPTVLIVLSIVIFPLLANFWISFKPITLSELRPPNLLIKENIRVKSTKINKNYLIEYRYRNTSSKFELQDVIFKDIIPQELKLKPIKVDSKCLIEKNKLICKLGDLSPKEYGKINFVVIFDKKNSVFKKNEIKNTKPEVSFYSKNVLTSLDFTLENFKKVFSKEEFFEVFKITIYYTLFGTAGALLVGLFAAQILKIKFRGRPIIRGLLLFPYVSPVIAVAFSWIILFDPFSGMINSMLIEMGVINKSINFFGQKYTELNIFGFQFKFPLALSMVILFEVWRYFPLSFLFILAKIQSIPEDIYEAAEIDGATPLQQFFYISLPFLISILVILFLLRFIWTFNKFDDIFLLTGGNAGTRTFTVNVYEQAFAVSNLGAGAAVAVVIFIFLLLFSIFFLRLTKKEMI